MTRSSILYSNYLNCGIYRSWRMHVVPECIVNNANEEIRVVEAVDGGSLSRRIKRMSCSRIWHNRNITVEHVHEKRLMSANIDDDAMKTMILSCPSSRSCSMSNRLTYDSLSFLWRCDERCASSIGEIDEVCSGMRWIASNQIISHRLADSLFWKQVHSSKFYDSPGYSPELSCLHA